MAPPFVKHHMQTFLAVLLHTSIATSFPPQLVTIRKFCSSVFGLCTASFTSMNLNALPHRPCIQPVRITSLRATNAQHSHETYTEPELTVWQTSGVLLASSLVAALLSRPLAHLSKFSFLTSVPGALLTPISATPFDKRAHFMRTLTHTRWWTGPSILGTTCEFACTLGMCIFIRDALVLSLSSFTKLYSSNFGCVEPSDGAAGSSVRGFAFVSTGCAAGAMSGVMYTLLRYPYDMLCATAHHMRSLPTKHALSSLTSLPSTSPPSGSHAICPEQMRFFCGPWEVLTSALRDRPAILRDLYKNAGAVALAKSLQLMLCFGCYNALRYDGVYRGSAALFVYCFVGSYLGLAAQYPCMALRQQLHVRNAAVHGPPMTYYGLLREMRRRHGLSKVYDGFFHTRPFLSAVSPALLLTCYDIATRRLTKRLHPECSPGPAQYTQSAYYYPVADYVHHIPSYEFASSRNSLY